MPLTMTKEKWKEPDEKTFSLIQLCLSKVLCKVMVEETAESNG